MTKRARPARDRDATVQAVANRLHSASIHLLRRARRVDSESRLPAPQLSALSVIVYGGPLTLGSLAAAEQVRPPTMTRLVASMEADGLVERRPDQTDRRVVRVQATARGRRLLEEGRDRRIAVIAEALSELPPSDIASIDAALDAIEKIAGSPHARSDR
jgi:DNA-binding MarR family transcriptional regulator